MNRIRASIITIGDEFAAVRDFIPQGRDSYTAAEVIDKLLAGQPVVC